MIYSKITFLCYGIKNKAIIFFTVKRDNRLDINIAIVEDDNNIRTSLSLLISGSPGFNCVGSYKSSEEALLKINSSNVEVVLMDINLPNMNGIECTRHLKQKFPTIQIIMQTVYENSEMIFESLKAGASGYLLKRTRPSKILEAIEEVYNGGSPMSSQIARMVVESFQVSTHIDESYNLTKREKEVLDYLSKGFRYKEIAEELFISMDTIRSHIRNIYEKLQVRSRTEAVLKYRKR